MVSIHAPVRARQGLDRCLREEHLSQPFRESIAHFRLSKIGKRGKAIGSVGGGMGYALRERAGRRRVLGVRASEDELGEVEGGLCAVVFDATSPVGAKEVEAEGVGGGVDRGEEAGAEGGPLGGVELAFEEGELDALAVVGAVFGDVAEAAAAGGGGGGDVVGDEDEHGVTSR